MRDPVVSLRVWSFYVLGIGAALLLVPNLVFDILGIPNTDDVWVRVLGLVAIVLGVVYLAAAAGAHFDMVRASVNARAVAVVGFLVLWITGGPWQLGIFAALDLAGLAWSWSAVQTADR